MSYAPTELQLDALREVANIGCGHAASALSQLVGGRAVQIEVPRVLVTHVAQMTELIGGPDSKVVAATLLMEGDLQGTLLLVLPEADAHRLAGLLLNAPSTDQLSDVQRSAIGEAANIVASACLSAISKLAGLKLLPTIPVLSEDSAGAVLDEALARVDTGGAGLVVVLEARFATAAVPRVGGQFLVLPDKSSLKKLLEKLGV